LGLNVLLPVLLSGFLGALFVFFLGVFREFIHRRRELRGIARLVHSEITLNHLALETFYEKPQQVLSPLLTNIRTETWEGVHVRLAEMMPADDLGSLVYYYMYMQDLKQMPATTHGGPVDSALELAKNQLGVISEQERDATVVALAYANLGSMFGWGRMRRRISEHRRQHRQSGVE
jgi:uncharacterized integral membrane protein